MRILLISLLLLVIYGLLGCDNNQKKKNYLTEQNLKGNVKDITEYDYKAISKFGKPEKDSLESNTDFKYDKEGKISEKNKYEVHGKLERKVIYIYDTNGKELEQKAYGKNGDLIQTYFSKYNEKGILTDWKNIGSDGKLSQGYICKYDEKENLIERSNYDTRGSTTKEIYTYDNKGKPLEMLV